MAQEAEVIGIGFFLESHREGAQPDHAELAQQSKGLLILGTAAAFAHGLQCGLVGTFEARKKADTARLFVKVQDVGVADDIIGAGGADDGNDNVFRDQRLLKRLPRAAGGGWIFIGKVDQFHAMGPHQPSDFDGKFDRVAMTPLGSEPALAAIGAKMRAAPRENCSATARSPPQ